MDHLPRLLRPAALLLALLPLAAVGPCDGGAVYYVDSVAGDDANPGTSPDQPWKTLRRASRAPLGPGAWLLLRRGRLFKGKLLLKGVAGTAATPVVIGPYGDGTARPKIDGAGYTAGVQLDGCAHVVVRGLEIVSDGQPAIDPPARTDRFGVYVMNGSRQVTLEDLYIHHVFASVQTRSEGRDGTTAYGQGIYLEDASDVTVRRCRITHTGRYGIRTKRARRLAILDNRTDRTGGSGLQMGFSADVVVRGNVFDHPGSYVDRRMHGRGSGSWPFASENILYERNAFMNARGKADSAGVHIDYNCRNVVAQYNFSMNNAGGFIEILGNDHNCAYRYNISVDDGWRRKGGAVRKPGRVVYLSGYVGKAAPTGPFNSYIYNNTIYARAGKEGVFVIHRTARGVLIANNIFYFEGRARVEVHPKPAGPVVFRNNLYNKVTSIPARLAIKDTNPFIGDPGFRKRGGARPQDYVPTNLNAVGDRGIVIQKLPGDSVGLTVGLTVTEDFFGNPIRGRPDLGAVEVR